MARAREDAMNGRTLLFVYGNDSGVVNSVIHAIHKIVSPATYTCNLCALTYGPLRPRAAWSRALAKLGAETMFLHRDEMLARYGRDQPPLPAVFVLEGDRPTLLISKAEIAGCSDLDALIARLETACAAARRRTREPTVGLPTDAR
jgi:hypothetical protein